MKKLSAVLSILLMLAACAPKNTPQQQAFLEELANRRIVCNDPVECDVQWNRALQWVSEHTTKGIRTASDNLIDTNRVPDGNQPPLLYPEYSVVRYKIGKQSYAMDFDTYCNYGFDCNPSALKLRAGFALFVMGPPPGVTVSADGTKVTKTIHSADR